jgi:hypothetical protein
VYEDCICEKLEAEDYAMQRQVEREFIREVKKPSDNPSYYARNRERLLEKQKAYDAAHREEKSARRRQYYQEHCEEMKAKQRAYYRAHREEIAAKQKANREKRKAGEKV